MKTVTGIAAVALALLATGCGTASVREGDTSLDGVSRVYTVADLDASPRLTIEAEPLVVLRNPQDDPDFDLPSRLEAVLMQDDGSVVAYDSRRSLLLLFDRTGLPDRVVARRGQGPGEVRGVDMIAAEPDGGFSVYEIFFNRRTRFDAQGAFISTAAINGDLAARPVGYRGGKGLLPDGSLVATNIGVVPATLPKSGRRSTAPVWLMEPAGETDTLTLLPNLDLVERRTNGWTALDVIRFSRGAHAAVWDSLVAVSDGSSYRIDMLSRQRDTVFSIGVARQRRPVSQAMIDQAVAWELDYLRNAPRGDHPELDPHAEQAYLQSVRDRPAADSLPPFHSIHAWPGKILWVIDPYVQGDAGWTATAYRADGAILGRLAVDGLPVPRMIWDDRLAVVVDMGDGVGEVRFHRISGLP